MHRVAGLRHRRGQVALVLLALLVTASSASLSFEAPRTAGAAEPTTRPRLVIAGVEQLGRVAEPTSPDVEPSPSDAPELVPAVATPSASATAGADGAHIHDATALLRYYTVKSGDTLWTIARSYNLRVATLVAANGMDDTAYLQIGQELVVPPVDGLLYTVAPGDTLESIATHYKITPASIYLASDLDSAALVVGMVLMLPGATPVVVAAPTAKPAPVAKKTTAPVKKVNPPTTTGGGTARWGASRSYNGFTYGYCTWGAAELFHNATGVYPGWVGDARQWAVNAAAVGWSVTATARVRSVVVFPPWVEGAFGLGHVAWVTSVDWTHRKVTVREMNGTAGWGRWDTRTVDMDSRLRYILAP